MENLALPAEAIAVKQFLADHADFHKLLSDDLYDAVYFVDPERRILYWNHAAESLSGYAASEVVGRRCSDNLLCHVDESGHSLCENDCPLSHSMQTGHRGKADVYMRCKDGHRLAVSVRLFPFSTATTGPWARSKSSATLPCANSWSAGMSSSRKWPILTR